MFFRRKKKSSQMEFTKLEESPVPSANDSLLKYDNCLIGGINRVSCKKSSDDAKRFICFLLDNNYKFNAFCFSEDSKVIIGCDTYVLDKFERLNKKKSIGASGEMTIEEAKELIQHLVNNNHDFDLHYEAKENKLCLIGKSDMFNDYECRNEDEKKC